MTDVLISLAVILASVMALAILTDRFFIPSLDALSRRLKLSDEVAGASLMAVGSSAPELAIALMALFSGGGEHSDVGIGTIVGSAVFNVLAITGLSAVAAGGFYVHAFAVRRDILYYLLAIAYLAAVFFDGHITLMEALLGLAGYAAYIILLVVLRGRGQDESPAEPAPAHAPPDRARFALWHRVEAVIAPLLLRATGAPEKHYLRAFAISIVLIVGLSYALVESTIVFAQGIGIPPVIVALTLLAAGTSAPDLMSSLEVAREGRGGMAVANAVGSNTFDLLVGLALPWAIALTLLGARHIEVGADGLWISVGILAGTTLALFAFLESERELSRREGWVLLTLYGVFVLYTLASGAPA